MYSDEVAKVEKVYKVTYKDGGFNIMTQEQFHCLDKLYNYELSRKEINYENEGRTTTVGS